MKQPGVKLASDPLARAGRWASLWAGVILLAAAQGYLFAQIEGRAQPWWPTLGYVSATLSVWIVLAPALLAIVRWFEARFHTRTIKVAIFAAGLGPLLVLQVALFVALFYPVYGGDPVSMGRFEMAARSLAANLNTNAAVYAGLVFIGWRSSRRRSAGVPMRPANPHCDLLLQGKGTGKHQLIPVADVDWINAAGDYAEVHAGARSVLIDESLDSLAARLSEYGFARVHRGAIVRLSRVRDIRSLGRGDAMLSMEGGTEVRLSRRYRATVMAQLPH